MIAGVPCPVCETLKACDTSLPVLGNEAQAPRVIAFAYGVALGKTFADDLHGVTERCCPVHRMAFVSAMAVCAVEANR